MCTAIPSRSVRSSRIAGRCPTRNDARWQHGLRRGCAPSPRTTLAWSATSTTATPVLDFLAREKLDVLVPLGTSCPDHFLRTKIKPLVVDATATDDELAEVHEQYRDDYRAYYERHASADSPPMRGADPAIILVPGVGMFSYGRDKQTARVAGEFYVNAINVMRGAESVSTYAPID